jgi:hypothetical protein
VVSAPWVDQGIAGGRAGISGDLTRAAAKNLAALIGSGGLPVALDVGDATTGERCSRDRNRDSRTAPDPRPGPRSRAPRPPLSSPAAAAQQPGAGSQ